MSLPSGHQAQHRLLRSYRTPSLSLSRSYVSSSRRHCRREHYFAVADLLSTQSYRRCEVTVSSLSRYRRRAIVSLLIYRCRSTAATVHRHLQDVVSPRTNCVIAKPSLTPSPRCRVATLSCRCKATALPQLSTPRRRWPLLRYCVIAELPHRQAIVFV